MILCVNTSTKTCLDLTAEGFRAFAMSSTTERHCDREWKTKLKLKYRGCEVRQTGVFIPLCSRMKTERGRERERGEKNSLGTDCCVSEV